MSDDQIQVTDTDGGKMVICPEYFDISVASEFQQTLINLLNEKPEKITFDVASVEILDTSIGQISCAFMRDAEKEGIDAEWKNASESVCQSVQLLGLEDFMKLESN
ncbi:MAG: STAS domain-containing protein [Gammaproteobacteria bacterium]|nr:STAS domain-containing protein [Gammaproteobacteria bacterium]